MSPSLTLENIWVAGERAPRLGPLSLTLPAGQRILLAGPNGAGKSTLLAVLSGDLEGSGGTLTWPPSSAWAQRRAVLTQRNALDHPFTAEEVVRLAGVSGATARAVLEELGAGAWAQTPYPRLSGGLARLVHLARVLAHLDQLDPTAAWGFFDEPLAHLDWRYAGAALRALSRRAAAGYGVVVAAHELNLAVPWAEHVVLLCAGRLEAEGAVGAVLTPDRLAEHWGISGHVDRRDEGAVLILEGFTEAG